MDVLAGADGLEREVKLLAGRHYYLKRVGRI